MRGVCLFLAVRHFFDTHVLTLPLFGSAKNKIGFLDFCSKYYYFNYLKHCYCEDYVIE